MSEPVVITVRGPLRPADLGITLMHEHVLIDMLREYREHGLMNDPTLAVEELGHYRAAGGRSLVDMTNSMGRQPEALRWISEQTGLNIVLGCGWYRHQYYDTAWIDRMSTNQLADRLVRELTEGIDGTGIRAGIIGEIGCDQRITAQEERVFRAAARAQKQVGVAISTHAARWPVGGDQLDLLCEEGVDPQRIIIGHCDTVSSVDWRTTDAIFEYHRAIARRGAYVQFDSFAGARGGDALRRRVDYVAHLIREGYERQILLSQDVAFRSSLRAFGGIGYDFILRRFVAQLEASGVTKPQINGLLVENPRRALTGT